MVIPIQHRALNNTVFMSNHTSVSNKTTGVSDNSNPHCDANTNQKVDFGYEGEFYWSRSQVGYALGAFFYAYIPMQVIAGVLADKFGIRHVVGIGILTGGILSLLTPVAARLHYGLLLAVRLLMGLSLGVMFPCVNSCIGKWVPDNERSTFVGAVFSGPSAGIIVSYLVAGYLCPYSWTLVFYILGGVAVLWYIAFMFIVFSSPEDHPRISNEEKLYIRNSYKNKDNTQKPELIPWKSILTSPSVWGLCIAQFSSAWVIYTSSSGIPLYLQDVLYFNIKSNGLLSSIPPFIIVCCGTPLGTLFDFLHRTVIKSRRVMRKTAHSIYALGATLAILVVGHLSCEHRNAAIAMFSLVSFCVCFKRSGSTLTPSDIAPRLAGLVYGVANCFGNFSGFLAPMAIGNLTLNGTQAEWQKIFFLAAGVSGFGWLCFVFLVSTEEQPWARAETQMVATVPGEEEELEMKSQNYDQSGNDVELKAEP